MSKLNVEWTGSYPCLCHGEWIISYDGIRLTVPEDVREDHMNTYGEYGRWYFDEEYMEEWEYYTDGYEEDVWIENNIDWIKSMFQEHGIEVTDELLSELFAQIQINDWRHGSCGGCI